MNILDKLFMILLMTCFTIFLPFLYVGFIVKWALIDAKSTSMIFYSRMKELYISAYREFIK